MHFYIVLSFVEPTLGGGKERRVLYDGSLDVDMIIFTSAQFETAIKDGVASWQVKRQKGRGINIQKRQRIMQSR